MKTVLVLEDDRRVLDFLCLVLTSKGYAALDAGTAEEALWHAENCGTHGTHIDLFIADVVLTVSTGIRVGVQMKRSIPELKVILTSGYPWSDQNQADLGELAPDSVTILRKPFSPAILLEQVHKLIGPPAETLPANPREFRQKFGMAIWS
jgi:two-component system cell cycle sensor histidine kinase/response regulator CckA